MDPSKVYNYYITAHGYKRRPGNFYWALFFHMWFSLLWKFYWAGAWVHEYTKLRKPPPQTPLPLDGNPVTVAVKRYEDDCHYVGAPVICGMRKVVKG